MSAKALACEIRLRKGDLAADANVVLRRRHADWDAQDGDRGRRLGEERAAYLLEFLASAIETDLTAPFEDYARWTTRMLGARGIAPAWVAESFAIVGGVLGARLAPEQAAVAARYLAAASAACADPSESQTAGPAESPLSHARDLFTQAILSGRRQAALDVALEALRGGARLIDFYADAIQESLYDVGRRWEAGAITIADEHMATAIAQFVLARLYSKIDTVATRGKALITGVEGELHQIGAHMVADALEADGWSVRFLGVNVPSASILRAIDEHGPAVIGISATLLPSVPRVRELIEAIRARPARPAPRIFVGGGVFRRYPALSVAVGADASALDVRGALAAATP